ncbi:hypothetical protein EO238_34370, partial [Citrobacter sp. AAK_AS5]
MAAQAAVVDPSKGLTIENKFIRLEFEPGGMGLAAMIDRAGGFNHVGPVEGKHLLWEVNFGRGTQVRPM